MSHLRLFLGPVPLRKSSADKPPPGYHVAPGSKHGGFTDGHGGYWYPGHAGTVQAIPPGGKAADAVHVPGSGPTGGDFAASSHPSLAQPGKTAIVHIPTGRVVGQVKPAAALHVVEALHGKHTGIGGSLGGGLDPKAFANVRATMATSSASAGSAGPAAPPTVTVAPGLPFAAASGAPLMGLPTSAAGLIFVKSKAALGGAQPGSVVKMPGDPGRSFLLKPSSPIKVTAEAAGSQIAALVMGDGKVARASVISMDGNADSKVGPSSGLASVQEMVPNGGALPKDTGGLMALTPDLQVQIIASHVGNWMSADHDAHGEQYLKTPDGKGLIKIDQAQSFKHLGQDKLDVGYHPNATFNESKPAPLKLLEAFGNGSLGALDLGDPRIEQAVAAAEAIPDATIRSVVAPYEAAGKKPIADLLIARRNTLRADFEHLFSKVLSKRMGKAVAFTFGAAPALVKAVLRLGSPALRKSVLATGESPLPSAAVFDADGLLLPDAARLVRLFARAVQGAFGNTPVRMMDAAGVPALRAAMTRLAAIPDVLSDVLSDLPTREEMAA